MSFQEDITAFVNIFGVENSDIAFPFAITQWESSDDRNKFIAQLVQINNGQKIGTDNG